MKNPGKGNGDDDDMMLMMAIITNIVDIAKCQSLLQALSPLLQSYMVGIIIPDFTDEETKAKRGSCFSSLISSLTVTC